MAFDVTKLRQQIAKAQSGSRSDLGSALRQVADVLADFSDAELAVLNAVTAGTVTASKAVVVDANKDASAFRDIYVRSVLGVTAAQGVAATITGGASTTAGNTGGAFVAAGAAGIVGTGTTAGDIGGAASITSGVGGAKTGAGTANGGAAGAASVVGGVGGDTASSSGATGGAGGDAKATGGAGGAASAGTSNGGNGGNVILTPGAGGTSAGGTAGKAGAIRNMGLVVKSQDAPAAKTVTAAITAAELVAGLITTTGATAPSIHQLPTGTQIDAVVGGAATGDSFDFHLINTGTGGTNDATITVNTDVTIVGNPTVGALTDATIISGSGHFRARRSGANTWVVYRLA
ncbi:MAG: hypothetical protein FJX55_03575 [Alphaproteobacteria bacterium]|nr:hypothetical protein [Alphaproteobacteria bacterium]